MMRATVELGFALGRVAGLGIARLGGGSLDELTVRAAAGAKVEWWALARLLAREGAAADEFLRGCYPMLADVVDAIEATDVEDARVEERMAVLEQGLRAEGFS